jgi:hypothetical protein
LAKRLQVPVDHVIKPSANASGTLALDRANGEYQVYSLTGNVTAVTFTGWPASGEYGKLVLEITNTGSFTIAGWPAAVKWPGGTVPTITSGSGKDLVVILTTRDAGTTVRGNNAGQDYA